MLAFDVKTGFACVYVFYSTTRGLVGWVRGLCMMESEIEKKRRERKKERKKERKIRVTLGIISPSMPASEREKMPRMAMASHETLKAKQ